MELDFTLEELIRQIQADLEETGDCWTARELAKALGLIPTTANRIRVQSVVFDLIQYEDGRASYAGYKPGESMRGPILKPAYRLSEEGLRHLVKRFRTGR